MVLFLDTKVFLVKGVQALGTVKAGVVPVGILVVHLLGVDTGGLAAFPTGVGTELVKALQVALVAILYILPLQGVPAVVAVKLLSYGTHLIPGGTSYWLCGQWDIFGKGWI